MAKFVIVQTTKGKMMINVDDISYLDTHKNTLYLKSLIDEDAEYIDINRDLVTKKFVLDAQETRSLILKLSN